MHKSIKGYPFLNKNPYICSIIYLEMKIAILSSGILPVPAVRGGAVETHMDFCLKYNDEHHLHDITVFSVWRKEVMKHPALQSKVNHYRYIDIECLHAKVYKFINYRTLRNAYFHHSVEYFFHQAWKQIQKEHYDIILLDNRPGYATYIDVPQDTHLFLYLHNDLLNNQVREYQDIYDKASRIFTVSNYISSRVRTINPDDTKCITIHNGIDIKAFSPEASPSVKRSQIGLTEDDFVLVFTGRVIEEKGVSELLDAMILLNDYPQIKLLIIGSTFYGNKANDNDFITKLQQKAVPIKDKVFFTGYIPYDQMPSYLKLADIAVIPSMWDEPFGNTVVEAMAAGIPLITTRSGGIPEICEGVSVIVERNNIVNNLVSAILYLYNNPEKRLQISKEALTRSKIFDEETYTKNYFAAIAKPI